MGQQVLFLEDLEEVPPPPHDLPACQDTCLYNFAPWRPEYVQSIWGNTGYQITN